ncbi:MAG: ABC transporter permease [Clostridia bacterium]|nr:ABC transporter permease [Clostridia bacterium]MBQ9920343.1 ABC transporter permease [Clostridia bacterium]
MIKYFYLQIKRLIKIIPPLLIACLVLSVALGFFLGGLIENDKNDAKNQKFKISIVGSTEDNYLSMGVTALKTLDTTRFSVEITESDQNTAQKDLERGKIDAYVVIPEGFSREAYRGNIMKIKYYTTDSAVGVVSIFKDEVTKTISNLLVDSQKGVYGFAAAMREQNPTENPEKNMTALALEYVSLILKRSEIYSISSLGIWGGLSTSGYFLCGIFTLFILLLGITATGFFVKKDTSLCRVISAKGRGAIWQITSEYLAYFLIIFLIVALILGAILGFANLGEIITDIDWVSPSDLPKILVKIIPSVAVITALQFFLFEICTSIVNGVLLQFLTAISLGYISGCFYPIYFFPEGVQTISNFLPSGIARIHLSNCIQNIFDLKTALFCGIYFTIFIIAAIIVRRFKISGRE